ncbi:MAG: hypothetical protein V4695_00970 [Pseudomonadota bacterium]
MNNKSYGDEVRLAVIGAVSVAALCAVPATATAADNSSRKIEGRYTTGDFHNHTTCSDGTLSLKKLVDKSVNTFGLDWFVQAGHGGNGTRNCTLTEDPFEPVPPALGLTTPPTYPSAGQPATDLKGPNQTWTSTIGNAAIKGDVAGTDAQRRMWKWQAIQEFIYPVIEKESRDRNKPIFVGLEQNAPGHEHTTTAIIDGQLPSGGRVRRDNEEEQNRRAKGRGQPVNIGNANAMAKYEYCFDRNDTDKSRGAANQWDCSVTGSPNNALIDPAARKIIVAGGVGSGTAGHIKTVEGIKWMAANHPNTSYYIPAHLERAGAFNPNGNNGFNVEHLRNFNNAAPTVAFGFESMPGHQAEDNRGSYSPNAVGGGTYGGTGIYAAKIGGVWDALLGEGRNWFFFASSDYHNRGSFGPDQLESTADFYPGEYTRDHVFTRTDSDKYSTRAIVDGLRSGNSFVANGGLIDQLAFVVCAANARQNPRVNENAVENMAVEAALRSTKPSGADCATMGEKLRVQPGVDLIVSIVVRDPEGKSNAPYAFANPSLRQIGVTQPLNAPVLDHIDVIGGNVTGYVNPANTAAYAGLINSPAASNPSAALLRTFSSNNWSATGNGVRKMTYRIPAVQASQYLRLRGSNLPAALPNETDASGNPILDFAADGKIACAETACPAHMTVVNGSKTASFDVAAWSDLWFYSNPVFIEVTGSTRVAGIN